MSNEQMSDRELLELAAKAAGADWVVEEDGRFEILSKIGGVSGYWNPLTDDGDALRLAVKLGMLIDVMPERTDALIPQRLFRGFQATHNGDPLAATRRAIVRAAAQLAKGADHVE